MNGTTPTAWPFFDKECVRPVAAFQTMIAAAKVRAPILTALCDRRHLAPHRRRVALAG